MSKNSKHRKRTKVTAVGIVIEILAAFVLLFCIYGIFKKPFHNAKASVNPNPADASQNSEDAKENSVQETFTYGERTQEIGTVKVIEKSEENYRYGIQYPFFGNEPVDQDVRKRVQEIIDLFLLETKEYQAEGPEEKATLIVEYESYSAGDQIVSVVYHLLRSDKKNESAAESVRTSVYRLSDGVFLGQQDIFFPGFENRASSAVISAFSQKQDLAAYMHNSSFVTATSALPGNYAYFSISTGEIRFYFAAGLIAPAEYGVQTAVIPRGVFEDLLRIDEKGLPKETEAPSEESAEVSVTPEPTDPTPSASHETEPLPTFEAPVPSVELDLNRPIVAFTFDDGPYAPVTGKILDVLETYNSHATFFVMGNRVNNYTDTLKRAYELGNQIGNHSFNHKSFEKIPEGDVIWQIAYTNDLVEGIIGVRPALVRVPYGAYKGQVSASVRYPMIQWNVDTLDWKTKDKDAIVAEVMRTISDGDIILMHDLYPATAEAFAELVPVLVEQGYQLVTVRDLYAAKGIPLEPGRVYFNTN